VVLLSSIAVPAFGQVILQPSTSSGTAVTIQPPSGGTVSGNMLNIDCPGSVSNPCFSVTTSGGLQFDGNGLTLGTNPQPTESYLSLYGGGGYNGYLQQYNAGVGPAAAPTVNMTGTGITGWVSVCVTYVTSTSPLDQTSCNPANENTANYSTSTGLKVSAPTLLGASFGTLKWAAYAQSCGANGCAAGSLYQVGTFQTSFSATITFTSLPVSGNQPPSVDTTGTPAQFSGYWFVSPTTSGLPCFFSGPLALNTDCTTGNGSNVLAFNPMLGAGDMIYGGSASSPLAVAAPQRLAANSGSKQFLTETSSVPSWASIATTDLPAAVVLNNQTNTFSAAGTLDLSAGGASALKVPVGAGDAPTANGTIANNSNNGTLVWGSGGSTTIVGAAATTGTGTGTTCTNQVLTAISGTASPTCTTLTSSFLPTSLVYNNTSNAGTSAMTLDMHASTSSDAFRVPYESSATAGQTGSIVEDSTNKNYHVYADSADAILGAFPTATTPTNGDCVSVNVASNNILLGDAGSACTVNSSATPTLNSTSSVTTAVNIVGTTSSAGPTPYVVNFYVFQSGTGVGCSTTPATVTLKVSWTDPGSGSGNSQSLNSGALSMGNSIASNNFQRGSVPVIAKASSSITYTTVYNAGSCTTDPPYSAYAWASQP